MLDTLTFIVTLVFVTAILAGATALILINFKFNRNPRALQMQAPLTLNAVSTANGAIGVATAGPLAVYSYSMTHIAATLLLIACIVLHVEMDGREDRVLNSVAPVYLDVNAVWMKAFIDPFVGLGTVLYGAFAPAVNTAVMVVRELLYATIKVLGSSAVNPFHIFKAFMSLPGAYAKLGTAFVNLFDTAQNTSWIDNTFDVQPAIQAVQTDFIEVIAKQTQFLCRAMIPPVAVATDVMTSPYLRGLIDSAVNTVIRLIQVWVRVAMPQHYSFDARPLFQQLRAVAVMAGGVLDDLLQAALNFGFMHINAIGKVNLPRPAAGTAIGRGVAAFISLAEVPTNIVAAALQQEDLYEASSAAHAVKQAHLATLNFAAGIDTIKTLVYTGNIGKQTKLDCNYYGYNFFADANIEGSIPETCVCEHGKCGNGDCNDEGACECNPGYHHVIPGARTSICVKTCQKAGQDFIDAEPDLTAQATGLPAAQCGPPLGAEFNAAGQCMPTGYCRCIEQGAVIDLTTGTCRNATLVQDSYDDADQMPKEEWGEDRCVALTTHDIGPPAECAVQSVLLAGIGAVYTGYEFFRELIFRFPTRFEHFDLMLQTFDGMWYPRMDSVSCEYRRDHSAAYDRTILPSNCMCDPPDYDDTELDGYDPYCARPTLNANVYSHMDAFAFYAGRKLPVKQLARVNYIFMGGTGSQFGFLSDTLGVYTTTAARSAVESLRILTHLISGTLTYILSVGSLVAGGFQGKINMLQMPTNCDWGIPFDGPVPPKYTAENWTAGQAVYDAVKATCAVQHCSSRLHDRIAAIEAMLPPQDGQRTAKQGAALLNQMHTAAVIHARNNEPSLVQCKTRSYSSSYGKCRTTNANNKCICNPELPIDATMQCRCMAMYPFIEAHSQDMQAYFTSDYLAKYYSQDIPWCYSMLLEHKYFYQLSSSIAVQNIFARFASSSPLSDKIDSQCYSGNRTYQVSTTSALTRLFQPNPSSTGYAFVGGYGGSIGNTTICQTLKKLGEIRWIKDNDHGGVDFASPGACFSKNYPQDGCIEGARPLRILAVRGFENPYIKKPLLCYQVPNIPSGRFSTQERDTLQYIVPVQEIADVITGYFASNYTKFCEVALARQLTAEMGFANVANANQAWVDITAYQEKLKGYTIETDTVRLHPKTCGFMTQNDNLVFQPCRYMCHTPGGFDTCWCNVTVHHDVRCNMGENYRKSAWKGIDMDRQMTTSIVSLLAMIPEGIRKDNVPVMCERFRAKGSEIAIVASMLTMWSDGAIADEVRERVARALFTVWEITQLSSSKMASTVTAKASKLFGDMKLPKMGDGSLKTMAKKSMIFDILRSIFPANLQAKACRFGDNACKSCTEEEDCQTRGSIFYCYAKGECPQDPHTDDAKPGFCCSNDCERTGTCPASHLCSTPTNGTGTTASWCRGGQQAAPDAQACHEYPRTNNYDNKCYQQTNGALARCVDLGNCRRYQCLPSYESCPQVAQSLGKFLVSGLFMEYMFRAVDLCSMLDALQKLIFSTSISGDGADIIPNLQTLVNSVFEILDRSFANILILGSQVLAGFFGVVSHPGDLRAWGSWLKAALQLLLKVATMVWGHASDFIAMAFDLIPAPVGPILSDLMGTVCKAVSYSFGHTFRLLRKVPGLGSVVPDHDWLNPDPDDKCFSRSQTEHESPLIQADLARRRLHGRSLDEAGLNETEYHHWKEVVDWTGNTTCARIGRHAFPPDSQVGYEIWFECLVNRQRVAVMNALMGKQYVPWTFLDDWMQPVKFAAKFWHGVAVYLTEGEGALRKWERVGYPTEASIDAMQYLDGWTLPKAPLQIALDFIPHHYPDYLHNKDGVGHNLYAVLSTMSEANIPSFRGKNWGALHSRAYGAMRMIAGGIAIPQGNIHKAVAPARRLSTLAEGETPIWQQEQSKCFEEGKACMDCAVLTEAVDHVIGAVEKAGTYYSNTYPRLLNNFVDTVAHWESTNQDPNTAIFPDVTIAYRPRPDLLPQPAARLRLQQATVISDVDWTQIMHDFFTVTDDTRIDVLEHSLWWYLKYPLKPCSSAQMVYDSCQAPKYTTGDAAALTLRVMAVFWTTGWLTGLQLPLLLQAPLATMNFLIFRYDYVPRCVPLLPVCLMTDLQHMITQLTPQCLCQALPALVVNPDMCTDEYCAKATIVYRPCPKRALGVLWAPTFLLRWQLPSVFELLSAYFAGNEEIAAMREDLEQGVPISPLDTTCALLGLAGVLAVLMLLKLAMVFAASVATPLMQATLTSVGSITLVVPFLLIDVPKMLLEQPGILLNGWE